MKNILFLFFSAFFLSGCSNLSVNVDYDPSYDFSNKTKFVVVYNNKEGDNTLTNDRIAAAITNSLQKYNYKQVSKEEADLIFVFHVNIMNMSDVRIDYDVIGYSAYAYGSGMSAYGGHGIYSYPIVIPKENTYRWTEAKLIIDALNPKTKKIVWRGIVKDEISRDDSTTEEKIEYINEVVSKVMKKFVVIAKEKETKEEKLN